MSQEEQSKSELELKDGAEGLLLGGGRDSEADL